MKFLKNNQISLPKWLNLFQENKYATPFQSPEYYNFINSLTGSKAEAFAVEHNDELVGVCVVIFRRERGLKKYFSRRAVIYGGPLICDNSQGVLDYLLKSINKELRNKVIFAETRNLNSYAEFKDAFMVQGWKYEPELNYHLDCSSEEIAWKNFNSSRKRQIKKAFKSGVTVEPAGNTAEIGEFYKILKELYVEKVKKPLQDLDFYQALYHSGLAKFLLVKYNSIIVGGIVCPMLDNKVLYELNVCGLDRQFKEAYPSVMATFAAIQYGYKNGFKVFDFMGAGSPDQDYGVREFKSKFGGVEVENGRFLKIYKPFLYKLGKLAVNRFNWLVHYS